MGAEKFDGLLKDVLIASGLSSDGITTLQDLLRSRLLKLALTQCAFTSQNGLSNSWFNRIIKHGYVPRNLNGRSLATPKGKYGILARALGLDAHSFCVLIRAIQKSDLLPVPNRSGNSPSVSRNWDQLATEAMKPVRLAVRNVFVGCRDKTLKQSFVSLLDELHVAYRRVLQGDDSTELREVASVLILRLSGASATVRHDVLLVFDALLKLMLTDNSIPNILSLRR